MRKTQLKNEFSQDIYGVKYSKLDEGQKEFVNDELSGLISFVKEMEEERKKKTGV